MAHSRPPRPRSSQPPARWRDGDAQQRRKLIIDTALKLLHREGLCAVTIRRVAGKLHVGAMTLYTYIEGQDGLRMAMVQRGFDMLKAFCGARSTIAINDSWRGGARAYVQFAMDNPNLYKLMFDTPMPPDRSDLLNGELKTLFDKVRVRLETRGFSGEALRHETRKSASRYWIALHGLASLAIAGRQSMLEGTIDELLDDLLERVAPA